MVRARLAWVMPRSVMMRARLCRKRSLEGSARPFASVGQPRRTSGCLCVISIPSERPRLDASTTRFGCFSLGIACHYHDGGNMQCSFLGRRRWVGSGFRVGLTGRRNYGVTLRMKRIRSMVVLATSLSLPAGAMAQTTTGQAPQDAAPETRASQPAGVAGAAPIEAAPTGFWVRPNLLGDPGGVRSALSSRGLTLGVLETAEVYGNPTGGVRQTTVVEGVLQLSLGIDTQKAFGLPGGTFNVSAYQIHGRGLSANALGGNFLTASSAEAERGLRLFELWYEQALFDQKVSIRVGQMAADQEFIRSEYAGLFTNATFGWPGIAAADLPSGGPAYPLGAPGVRVRVRAGESFTVLAAAFNGDVARPGRGGTSALQRNLSGTDFRLNDGLLALLEVQYARNQGEGATGLPGTFKLGAFYHDGLFDDQRVNAYGQSLADPAAVDANPKRRRHDYAVYAVADQLVWRPAGVKDGGLGVFGRVLGAPSDRNVINFYLDAGVTYKGAIPGREDDTVGLGFGYARVSGKASKLDSDTARFGGSAIPTRRHEAVLELTYQAQVAPWWSVQPTAQYVFNPGGSVENPGRPGKRIPDALVLGLRTAVTF